MVTWEGRGRSESRAVSSVSPVESRVELPVEQEPKKGGGTSKQIQAG